MTSIIQIIHLTTDADLSYANSLVIDFEKQLGQLYPIGDKFFSISHGSNYFAFFQRLGKLNYYIIESGKDIVGVAASVLRQYNGKLFWYLCDLKINPDNRGRNYTLMLFMKLVPENSIISMSGYMICMDPESVRMIKIMKRVESTIPFIKLNFVHLRIYQLNATDMAIAQEKIQQIYGHVSYLPLNGIKDIVVDGQSLPILHAQYGYYAEHTTQSITPGSTHMFCCVIGSELEKSIPFTSNVTATVISHAMPRDFDFNLILTSEI